MCASVVHWQAKEGDGQGKTLQSKMQPLDVAISSSKSQKYYTLNFEEKMEILVSRRSTQKWQKNRGHQKLP